MSSVFTSDWVSPHVANWQRHLKHLAGRPGVRGLEIGSYEGRSAVWFAENILSGANSTLDCVDGWVLGSAEVENRFDLNTERYKRQINKHKTLSFEWLIRRNVAERECYDFIYIDGDHRAYGLLRDLTLSWPLLKKGGILLCDDYLFIDCPANQLPRFAIDAFLNCCPDWRDLHKGYQRIVQKGVHTALRTPSAMIHSQREKALPAITNGSTGPRTAIEALITCVNYADYLAETLPYALKQVDRVVVVTSPEDEATARVVAKYDRAELVKTEAFFRDGAVFNKGAAINEGLKRVAINSWVLLMDADIAIMDPIPIPENDKVIYGARRTRVCGPIDWKRLQQDRSILLEEVPWDHCTQGYFPYGFFQLYYRDAATKGYPENSDDASNSDCNFSLQFPKRVQLNFRVHHLEMPDAVLGVNWKGRQTFPFAQETLCTAGVLTAANANYWPTLRLMAEACKLSEVCLCVFDHGLEVEQVEWLSAQGVEVRPDSRGRSEPLEGARDPQAVPPQAWLKPRICRESPFEHTVWIDADAVPVRRLNELIKRVNHGPWIARECYLNEIQLRSYYLMTVNLFLGSLPPLYAEASQISTGVFGFRRGDQWLERWDELCQKIRANSKLAGRFLLLDQSALVCLMSQVEPGLELPKIVEDRAYNWSANGCNSKQAQHRVNYAWDASDCLESIRSDHPDAAVVHWVGLKPWRKKHGEHLRHE